MKNKFLCVLLAGAIILTAGFVTAFASNTTTILDEAAIEQGFDTLSYSENAYRLLAEGTGISDKNQVKKLIVGYLALEKAYVRSPEKYTRATGFVDETAMATKTIVYRESESDYLRALNHLMGWTILEDKLSFNGFNVVINQDFAKASIVEDYFYFINDDFGGESFRRREYTFELMKVDGSWKIVDVKTNDPWETEENFSYTEIDIDSVVAQLVDEMSKSKVEATNTVFFDDSLDKEERATTSLNMWTYSVSDAVNYAVDHYSDTSNTVFGFTNNKNCQNFASQCVWAGLGGTGTSTSARPAVSTAIAGSDAPNVWQRNVATTCYSSNTYWLNWTWDNTRGFAYMMKVSTSSKEGPFGNTIYSGSFGYTDTGNVLEVDWEGDPDRDTLDHAMFVTEVSGTSGTRTTSQVKIAAHTSPTNSAYQTLSTYTTMPSSAFARVVIWKGYYATTQP